MRTVFKRPMSALSTQYRDSRPHVGTWFSEAQRAILHNKTQHSSCRFVDGPRFENFTLTVPFR